MNPATSLNAGTLAATPVWFPQLLDPVTDRLLLVEKTEADYRDSAFLDERSLKPERPRHGGRLGWSSWRARRMPWSWRWTAPR